MKLKNDRGQRDMKKESTNILNRRWYLKKKLEKVAIIAMYCHLRPPDAITFPI